MAKRIILTGIKPTGSPHIGNYLGAIRPALAFAEDPELTPLYFIADYHALTMIHDRETLAQLTYEVAATWLAFGLDPERTLFYRQSEVPEIFELTWILSCFTSKGWMNKAHAYKAKVADNEASGITDLDTGVNMGLYNYPILMAADILLFGSDLVPVGQDQQQHVEIARDIAQRFNHVYGADLLKLPQAVVDKNTAIIPGLDGRKMSKSYDNTIPLFAPAKQLQKLVARIVTDSAPPDAPKDPKTSHIFQIYEQLASPDQAASLAARYRSGIGWGDAKKALAELLEEILAGPRETYNELMNDRSRIDAMLVRGAQRARELAAPVMERVRTAVGIRR